MNLAALFSLISAAILALLPVLLLFGRRRMNGRARGSGASEPLAQGDEQQQPARGADAGTGETAILDRLVRGGPAARAAARGAQRPVGWVDRDRRQEPQPREPREAARTTATRLQARLARLTPLQRAIAYGEILGPPAALREPGRRESL